MRHELKTDPDVFAAVLTGRKTHEIRFNDRSFKVGDMLLLRETKYSGESMKAAPDDYPLEYTGREAERVVSHVLDGYGLQPGWVVLSFASERAAVPPAAVISVARKLGPPIYAQEVISNVKALRYLLVGMLDAGHQFESADALLIAIEEGVEEAMSDAHAQGEQEEKDRREDEGRAAVSPATPAAQEHFDEIKATLTGAHTIMENVAAIERRVGPLGSHARGYTHKISAALRNLDALVAGRVAPGTADAISLLRKAHRTLACAALTQIRGGESVWTEIGRFLAAAPAEAREPSPTAGMNLGERIKHVGGRENAAGYIEFGSEMAVDALIQHVLRDLPRPVPADAGEAVALRAEVDRLNAIINTPQSGDFLRAVSIEAEHQRQRWSSDHDAGKTPADWFWLVGYLAGKSLHAHAAGNVEKAEHHVITTAAALANWHLAIFGKTDMRPGTEQPGVQGAQGGKGGEA